LRARNGGKFPVLNVKEFCHKTAGNPGFTGFKMVIATFRANVFLVLHDHFICFRMQN
jgi:hypothetical protein